MDLGGKFDYAEYLSYSDLLFLLQLSDEIAMLPAEEEIFSYCCRAFAAKIIADEVVVYDFTGPMPQLKCHFKRKNATPQPEPCTEHFRLYSQQSMLKLPDVKNTHPELFDKCSTGALLGVLLPEGGNGMFLLEMRNDTPTEWRENDVELARSGFQKILSAVLRIREIDKFRKQSFDFETTANALGLSVWGSSSESSEPQGAELKTLKEALVKAALPDDVVKSIAEEDVPRVEIEINRSLAEGKDYEIEYQRVNGSRPQWVKLKGGKRTDAAGRPHLWYSELDISEFKHSQTQLIKDKKNKEFLLWLTDELSTIKDPVAVQKKAAEMLGRHFDFSMAHYSMYTNGLWTTEWQYRAPGVTSSMVGSHHDNNHPLITSHLKKDKTFVSCNLATDTRLEDEERATMKDLGVGAVVMSPISGGGVLKGSFVVAQDKPKEWTDDEISVIKEVARRTQSAVEHTLAEKALKTSEKKFRKLFNGINIGAAICKLIFDEQQKAADVVFEHVNPVAVKIMGFDFTGKTLNEIGFIKEKLWLEIYQRVARTGSEEKHILYSSVSNRWFDFNVVKYDEKNGDHVAILFNDITQKIVSEEKEKRIARYNAYQLKINDALRTLSSAEDVVNIATKIMAEALDADRLLIGESNNDHTQCVMSGYDACQVKFPGSIPAAQYNSICAVAQQHIPVVIDNVNIHSEENSTDIRYPDGVSHTFTDEEQKSLLQYHIESLMVFPVIKGSRRMANVNVHCSKPRAWNQEDFDFLMEAGERTWEIMMRLRSEEALRDTKQRYITKLEQVVRERTAEVKQSRDLFQSTMDASMDMIQVFEAVRNEQGEIVDFKYILLNHEAEKKMPLSLGKNLLDTQPGVVEDTTFEAFKQVVETGISQQYEKYNVQFDEWYCQSVVKLGDGVTTTTSDITQRKKAEESLRQSKDLLQKIIDAPNIGMAVYKAIRNETGEITDYYHEYINRASIEMLGEDFTGRLFSEHGESASTQLAQFNETIASNSGTSYVNEIEFRGRKAWFAITNTPIGDDRLVHTREDITQRKNNQQQILQLKEEIAKTATDKYYSIFNSIDQGFCIYEIVYDENQKPIDLEWVEVNPAYEKQTGLTNVTGKRHSDLNLNTESCWLEIYERVCKTGEAVRFEQWHQGTRRWYYTFTFRMGDQGSKQVAVVFYRHYRTQRAGS